MNRKKTFDYLNPIIILITFVFSRLPISVIYFIWNRLKGWHGKTGIMLRFCLLKSKARYCGKYVVIGPFVEIRNIEKISIGNGCHINLGCYIDAAGGIDIGNSVAISHNTTILSSNHTWNSGIIIGGNLPIIKKKVTINNDVWVGCGSRIMAGVTISEHCIVGAGAVVTSNVKKGSLIGGVPAKLIKHI